MRKYKDPKTHLLKNHIEPFVIKSGFKRYKSADFIKVDNDLVYCISLGLSQWGSKSVRVFYSVHSIFYPWLNINTYEIGDRLSSSSWVVDTHENVDLTASTYIESIEEEIFPWFERVNSVDKYIVLLKTSWVNYDFEIGLCMAEKGCYEAAKIYIKPILNQVVPYDQYFSGLELTEAEEKLRERKLICRKIIEAIESEQYTQWSKSVVQSNLNLLKL